MIMTKHSLSNKRKDYFEDFQGAKRLYPLSIDLNIIHCHQIFNPSLFTLTINMTIATPIPHNPIA